MLGPVITLANSIIGVSILAMPFCFKQCGIVLATLMLILSGMVVKMCCHLLLKSAVFARRRNYEVLAYQTFGSGGKLLVELSMIGFLMGTCTAFFCVMGDLAPPILNKFFFMEDLKTLRIVSMIILAFFCSLPLSLKRDLSSLAIICALSIGFYLVVIFFIVVTAWPSLAAGNWTSAVNLWRPAGIFQCLPIFFMALSCQPNVFEIYDSLSDPSVNLMNDVIKGAVNLCSACYISVGIFGYIAFSSTQEITGNILTSYPQSFASDLIKIGFVMSVAVSFPLVIFPCRTSIHSLMFKGGGAGSNDSVHTSNYIPPDKFTFITVSVISVTLMIGILVPDIEFVLGMVGSTIGACICVIFPSIIFLKLTTVNTTERIAAQVVFVLGLFILVLGTYVNLYEANRGPERPYNNNLSADQVPIHKFGNPPILPNTEPANLEAKEATFGVNPAEEDKKEKDSDSKDKRKEPVEPKPPNEDLPKNQSVTKKLNLTESKGANIDTNKERNDAEEKKSQDDLETKKKLEDEEKAKKLREEEEEEMKKKLEDEERDKKAEELLKELEKQKVEQQEIIKEQKQILKEMKDQKKENEIVKESNDNQNDRNNLKRGKLNEQLLIKTEARKPQGRNFENSNVRKRPPNNNPLGQQQVPYNENMGQQQQLAQNNLGRDQQVQNNKVEQPRQFQNNGGQQQVPYKDNLGQQHVPYNDNLGQQQMPAQNNMGRDQQVQNNNVEQPRQFQNYGGQQQPLNPGNVVNNNPVQQQFGQANEVPKMNVNSQPLDPGYPGLNANLGQQQQVNSGSSQGLNHNGNQNLGLQPQFDTGNPGLSQVQNDNQNFGQQQQLNLGSREPNLNQQQLNPNQYKQDLGNVNDAGEKKQVQYKKEHDLIKREIREEIGNVIDMDNALEKSQVRKQIKSDKKVLISCEGDQCEERQEKEF